MLILGQKSCFLWDPPSLKFHKPNLYYNINVVANFSKSQYNQFLYFLGQNIKKGTQVEWLPTGLGF